MAHRPNEPEKFSDQETHLNSDRLFDLGMKYSTGRSVPLDLLAAHKWFNLSAQRGNKMAAQLRSEIASEMPASDVAAAQRAARDWITKH